MGRKMKHAIVFLVIVCSFWVSKGAAVEDRIEKGKPKVGVGVFVFKDDKVLLGKRKGAHGSGDWAPPGGHLEFGESIEDCAKRELLEEAGLQAVSVKTSGWTNDVIDGNKHYITFFAVVDQFEGKPELLEPHKCEEWQWFSIDALPSPLFLPAQSFCTQYKSSGFKAPHEQVLDSLLDFYQARAWEQFHSPKNLVMDLASEAGELLDLFRWMSEEQSYHPDPKTLEAIQDEVADVFKAILYLAHKLKIDPIKASYQKFEKMKQKYPADQCWGKSLKYTAYEVSQSTLRSK
jgi:8-oxo-dGTP diphosphatase